MAGFLVFLIVMGVFLPNGLDSINYSITFYFSQKYKEMLEPLVNIYGGKVMSHDKKLNTYRWVVYRKEEVISLQKNYFNHYPPKSKKLIRVSLISKFFELKQLKCHLANP